MHTKMLSYKLRFECLLIYTSYRIFFYRYIRIDKINTNDDKHQQLKNRK